MVVGSTSNTAQITSPNKNYYHLLAHKLTFKVQLLLLMAKFHCLYLSLMELETNKTRRSLENLAFRTAIYTSKAR